MRLTDRTVLAMAAAAAAGAWSQPAVPLAVALGVLAVAVAMAVAGRRTWLLVLAAAAVTASLGHRATGGLDPPPPGPFHGAVTLVADPRPTAFGVRVDVRAGGRRFELRAAGAAGGAVADALAGERLEVTGRVGPPPPDAPWLVPRHVVGRLRADRVERSDAGSAPWRAANRFRRLLARGAEVLPPDARALYSGLVLGDDRHQTPAVVDDFRGAGLTHVLVVSGSNVAFVLVLARPLTRRLRPGWRWVVTIGVIGAFALVTRFEPSVLRASAMAALAASASAGGRPARTLRILSLAVIALVVVDPLLVRSVAFQLSVAASAGIAVLGGRLARRLRGPSWWREAVAVTLAAQLGVAPVLVPRFGGLPVASVPANLLAVPVAGLVTTWGLPAGTVAGLAGDGVARVAHLPTRVLVAWVAGVARWAAALPLGEVGTGELAAAVAAGAGLVAIGPGRAPWLRVARWALALVAGAALLAPAVALRAPPARVEVHDGATLYRSGGASVLVVEGRPWLPGLLEGLRRAGLRRLDLVVTDRAPDPELLDALGHRWTVPSSVVAEPGMAPVRVGPELVVVVGAQGEVVVTTGR